MYFDPTTVNKEASESPSEFKFVFSTKIGLESVSGNFFSIYGPLWIRVGKWGLAFFRHTLYSVYKVIHRFGERHDLFARVSTDI
jgi:hypothetical protein